MTDTDLFPEVATQTPLFDKPALIVCLVCGRGGRADMARPLICDRCGADVPAARSLVDYKLANAEEQLDQAYDKWLTARNTADTKTREHYDLYDACRMERDAAPRIPADHERVKKADNAERLAIAGDPRPVFYLIWLWLKKDEAGAVWDDVHAWAKQCDEVLR